MPSWDNPHAPPVLTTIAPTSGTLATEITFTGTGFTPNSRILVGSSDLAPWFVNSTTLKFTIPAGTALGATSLKVRNQDGQESAAKTFTSA